MKNILFFLMVIAIGPVILAQNTDIEKIKEDIAKATGREKIKLMAELSRQMYLFNPQKGLEIGYQALHLADSMKIPSENGKIYNNLGINYLVISKLDTAMLYFKKALAAASQYNDSLQMGWAYNGTGIIYEKKGDFDSSLIVFHKALKIFKLTHNDERAGRTLENIGTIHIHRGELKSSLSYLLEANSSFEKAGSTKNLPSLYIKIGRIYSETAEYATAEKWYEKGKQLSLDYGNYQEAGIAINAVGIMYKNQGKNEKALKTYLEVVAIADKIKNKPLLHAVYGNIGNVYQSLGNYSKAIDFHQLALNIAMSLNNPVETAIQFVNLGNDYNALKDYRNAIKYLEKALPVFTDTKTQSYLLSTYEAMITANNGLKNYDRSVTYYEKYVQLKDSLNKNELNTALDSLKVRFNTEQTQQENTMLAQKNEIQDKTISLQRNMIISAVIIAVLLIGFILMIFRNRQKIRRANILLEEKNQEISEKAEELKQSNQRLTELSKFKDSMQSFLVHDLKNALNIIINADLRSDPDQKLQGIRSAGKRMLNMVHNMLDITGFENSRMSLDTQELSCNETVVNACRQVKMQAATRNITLSFNQNKDYRLMADPGITERVLVNLLDNAIRHSHDGSTIEVEAEMQDGFLRIAVKDHGEGIPPELLPSIFEKYTRGKHANHGDQRSYGLGLAFCKMAVETHGGKIGAISEQGKGSEIWFTLPLASGPVIEIADHMPYPVISDPLKFAELSEEDLTYLREHYSSIRNLSIHQISDIKDLLNKPDEKTSAGISLWKNAVITSTNQYNSLLFIKLKNILTNNDG
ncbi:MAG: tetratricopeptide repeat-containing sensor histidine kinase [Bacteroidota bacterium]